MHAPAALQIRRSTAARAKEDDDAEAAIAKLEGGRSATSVRACVRQLYTPAVTPPNVTNR